MITRHEMIARTVKQDNDVGSFNSWANDQKGSMHTRRAKRLASKRLRQMLQREDRRGKDDY